MQPMRTTRTPGAEVRRRKAEQLREKEEQRLHRERLRAMLMQKLSKKYGRRGGRETQSIVAQQLDSLMAGKKTIGEPDLVELEKGIVKKLEARASSAGGRPSTVAGAKGQASSQGGGPGGSDGSSSSIFGKGPGQQRPGTASTGTLPNVLGSTSEWKLLDAYQVIEHEAASTRAMEESKRKKLEFKKMLDEQMELRKRQSTWAEMKRQDDEFAATQNQLLQDWRSEMVRTKKKVEERHLEQKRVRDMQITQKKEREAREQRERRDREERELEDCRLATENARQDALRKKHEARLRLVEIQKETARDRQLALDRKREEGLEDQRLMQEYKAKLIREEEERQNAFSNRMKRLEAFSFKSATEGAGHDQAEAIRRQEMLILQEAQRKERADQEREERDRRIKREKAHAMQAENKKLHELKRAQTAREMAEEQRYADRFIRESDEFLRDEATKFASKRAKMIEHQKYLAKQIEIAKKNTTLDMDDRERQLNRDLLEKLTHDQEILTKLQNHMMRTTYKKASMGASASAPSL